MLPPEDIKQAALNQTARTYDLANRLFEHSLKAVIALNGGAAIALLTFLGHNSGTHKLAVYARCLRTSSIWLRCALCRGFCTFRLSSFATSPSGCYPPTAAQER